VRNETCAHEAVLNEPAMIHGDWRRIDRLITRYWTEAVVVAIALLLWAPRLTGPIDLRWDAGVYYVLGTSLATGHGYRIVSEPGSPEALQYPPLLPTVVALHEWALGTTNPDVVGPWLRKLYFGIFMAYAFAAVVLARRHLQSRFAVAAVALSLVQAESIFFSDALFTELPFALVSVVFVLVAVDGPLKSRPWRETLSFGLAAIGFLLRTGGLALLAAWVLEALARRRWRLALVRGALALLPVIAWQGYVARVHGSYEFAHPAYEYQRAPYQFYNVSYAENALLLDPFRPELGHVDAGALARRITANLPRMMLTVGETVSTRYKFWCGALLQVEETLHWLRGGRDHVPIIPLDVVYAPIIGLSALVIAGVVMLARRRAWLMVFVILASVGSICPTPWLDQFQRYLMPLAPFLAIAAMLALSQLHAVLRAARLRPATITVGQVALAGLLLLPFVLQTYAAWELFYQRERVGASFVPGRGAASQHFFYHSLPWRTWEEAAAWIDAHVPPDAIVATTQRHLCYLRTGRQAVLPPMESNPTRARRLLEAVPVSYVIVDEIGEMASFGRRYALPAVKGDPLGWRFVQSFNGTQIYARSTGRP
jgi:hypothetical protein